MVRNGKKKRFNADEDAEAAEPITSVVATNTISAATESMGGMALSGGKAIHRCHTARKAKPVPAALAPMDAPAPEAKKPSKPKPGSRALASSSYLASVDLPPSDSDDEAAERRRSRPAVDLNAAAASKKDARKKEMREAEAAARAEAAKRDALRDDLDAFTVRRRGRRRRRQRQGHRARGLRRVRGGRGAARGRVAADLARPALRPRRAQRQGQVRPAEAARGGAEAPGAARHPRDARRAGGQERRPAPGDRGGARGRRGAHQAARRAGLARGLRRRSRQQRPPRRGVRGAQRPRLGRRSGARVQDPRGSGLRPGQAGQAHQLLQRRLGEAHRARRRSLRAADGAGKSTLLKLLASELTPTEGKVRAHHKLRTGRYSQRFVDTLKLHQTPVQHLLEAHPDLDGDEEEPRTALGEFGLPAGSHLTAINRLSGGQKARVVLASIALEEPHVLLLDEPTNHLDMQTIDALADALCEFAGGVVLVSHDSRLISLVCEDEASSEVWVVQDGTVKTYHGTFEEYKDELVQEIREEMEVQG